MCKLTYNLLTRFRNHKRYMGDVEGSPYFWGDICKERIRYFRNFTYPAINTLACCPQMPYHDERRPFVNHWFASTDGRDVSHFVRCIR